MRIGFSGSALQVNRSFQTVLRTQPAAEGSSAALSVIAAGMSVPAELADTVAAVSGMVAQADTATALADAVDANTEAVVMLPAGVQSVDAELLMQAAAQGHYGAVGEQ